jgi:hypothetical protein
MQTRLQQLEDEKGAQLNDLHADREAEKARVRAMQAAAERAKEVASLHHNVLGDEVAHLEAKAEIDRLHLNMDTTERRAREAAEEAFEMGRTVLGRQRALKEAEDERRHAEVAFTRVRRACVWCWAAMCGTQRHELQCRCVHATHSADIHSAQTPAHTHALPTLERTHTQPQHAAVHTRGPCERARTHVADART